MNEVEYPVDFRGDYTGNLVSPQVVSSYSLHVHVLGQSEAPFIQSCKLEDHPVIL